MEDLTDISVFEQEFLGYMKEKKHILMMYEDIEDYRYVAARFIADGLSSNDCCIMATDAYSHELVLQDLKELGLSPQNNIDDGSLLLIDVTQHYSTGDGFIPNETMEGWIKFTNSAVVKGYENVRAVGEATFCLGGNGLEDKIVYYENIINGKLFPDHPFMSLCVYDKNRYSEKVLRAAVQSHPMMVYGKKIFKNNIYFVPPDVYFSKPQKGGELDLWLANVEVSNSIHQQAIQSEEKLQQALEATNDGIWEYDLVTGEFDCSDRWATMLGFTKDEVPSFGCFCNHNIHPEDRKLFDDSFSSYLNGTSGKYEAELRLKAKDGSYRWIYTRGKVVLRDAEGKPIKVVGAHTDITEKKNAEKRLEESEQMFRMLFDDAPMPYQSLDAHGNFITVNKVFCDTLGYEPTELIGKNFSEFLHPDWKEHFQENFPRFKAVGEVLGVEFEMRKKDGDFVLVSFTGKIGKEPDGSFRQTHCVFRDISSERAYQEGLIKAKEEAELANHAKSMFLANMSHELRTPLNGIMGMHQLLKTTDLNEEQEGYVSLAIDSAKRLTNLLGDILDLTKIEAGKLNIIEKSFELSETFELAEQLFGPVCRQKGVNISFNIHSSLSQKLIGDQTRVQQILNNLIGNAVKFTESGSIRCEASPLPHKGKNIQRILFSVSDTGIGIDETKLDQLFEPFTQADEGYKRAYQGAGLGLSIVRQLVTLMGGSVAVVSELGKGTEFHFCLPFTIDEDESVATQKRASEFCHEPCPHSILVAEDEMVNRTALQTILKKAGYKVTSVENGAEALKELSKSPYDLVLMDIQMPIMDGVEAAEAIRSGKAGKRNSLIPIVALTAFAMSGDKESFLNAGMNGYLAKPVEVDELNLIVSEALKINQ
ncbi:PAS domain S-box protein [Salidesulfovibrio brasiliensis]|uniref:PAS domain S-box protein n=1 Tax=Salidesulfovibrio brasiliensis TaxID=221711 RepID=UPI0006D024A4|nr:PAS domain S-box protein [Salidesulfovibrio brasiliensis]